MDVLWIWSLLLFQLVHITDAGFLNNPTVVYVPYVHTENYVVWGNIEARCASRRSKLITKIFEGQKAQFSNVHLGNNFCKGAVQWNATCKHVRAVNEFQTKEIMRCTDCRISRNPQDMFYMEGMNVMKRSCAAGTCSRTCPSETCLSPDQTVNIDILCWTTPYSPTQGVSTSVRVRSYDNRLKSNCTDAAKAYGNLSTLERTHCSVNTFLCNHGYTPTGKTLVTCCNGTWSPSLPLCTKDCPEFIVANGTVTKSETSQGMRATITCTEGFTMVGQPSLICIFGKWHGSIPTCHSDCPELSVPDAEVLGRNWTHGSYVYVHCNSGYHHLGTPYIQLTCLNGAWTGPPPGCYKDCPELNVQHGRASSNMSSHGTSVIVSCDEGFSLTGQATVNCSNGVWVYEIPSCNQDCMPLRVPNGKKSSNSSRHGIDVTITCNEGYTLFGSPGRQTCSQGEWNGKMPTCIADCEELHIQNALLSGKDFYHGFHIHVSCKTGYQLSGNSLLICRDGKWNDYPPVCEKENDIKELVLALSIGLPAILIISTILIVLYRKRSKTERRHNQITQTEVIQEHVNTNQNQAQPTGSPAREHVVNSATNTEPKVYYDSGFGLI